MKRITKIRINNYKAYVKEQTIDLSNGKNLLLYGENGSGKSSLYHALRHFMESSINSSKPFETNYYSGLPAGCIEVTFDEVNSVTKCVIPGTSVVCSATETPANNTNNVVFLHQGFRVSGFLDYTRLLKVYLYRGSRPNLFELVMELLRNYVPINQGLTVPVTQMYDKVNREIGRNYHRTDNAYQVLKASCNRLINAFPDIINDLNSHLTNMLANYFPNFNLGISLVGARMFLEERGCVRDTHIDGEVFLEVTHYGLPMADYNHTLNEARLSAIAICLYLSTLKLLSDNVELKILYLDDVFVGLDSANRRPVVDIVLSEFADYQIFISTYDKSWYLLAREIIHDSTNWEYKELYEGQIRLAGGLVPRPIVVNSLSEIDSARKYLYDDDHPDYPAAANYMRKAYESLLSKKLYRPAMLNNDLEPVAAYKIGDEINIYEKFLVRIVANIHAPVLLSKFDELRSYLKPMLHPLSHYAPYDPVYKNELKRAEELYDEIANLLETADYEHTCRVLVSKGGPLMLKVEGTSGWRFEYYLETEGIMVSFNNANGSRSLTDTVLHVFHIKEYGPGSVLLHDMTIGEGNHKRASLTYPSIEACANSILVHIVDTAGENKPDAIVLSQITDMFYLPNVVSGSRNAIVYDKVLTGEI